MSDGFFEFITDTFGKENVGLCKHRTQMGDFIGWKYFIKIPNTRRNEANEVLKDTAHWATDETENRRKAMKYLKKWGVK